MVNTKQSRSINYLIKQLPMATVYINDNYKIEHASDQWIKIFNLNPNEVIGSSLHDLVGEINSKWKLIFEKCLIDKETQSGTDLYIDCNTTKNWFEWTSIPWFDEKENVIGIIVQAQNITKYIQNEVKAKKLEMLLHETRELSKIGTWEYNPHTKELNWCDVVKNIHEVPLDFVPTIEFGINSYKEGYSRSLISKVVDGAIQNGKPWNEKVQLITSKGNEIWVIAAGKPIFKKGKLISLIGTFQDVNEQTLKDIKIQESENLLRTLIDNLPLNVYIKDLESRKILVNKSECEYLGVEHQEELLGKSDFDLYDKKIAQISRNEDLKVINSMKPIIGKETVNITKDGIATHFLTSKIPVKGLDGKANALVGFSLDISKLKQKEEELRDLINVSSLQNKKLINFAHIVSHNLRSHTANFSMLLDFLINEKNEDEKLKIVNMLTDASDNLLETLDNLNEVVAINTNVNLGKHPIHLNSKIKAVQQNLLAFLRNNNAKIINNIPEDVHIKAIPAYLDSILMNFMTNAVKYKDPNRDPVITLSIKRSQGYTVLSIADNGLGIDLKKYGSKLFGMYKTFHNNTDARGIGLYITKNQIEAMNGKIITTSEVGKGTTFNIHFHEKD
ncbi:hypothetical protein SB49_00765 [Sediminicola sp. YIK13]|uniref:PAS domain-containing sensor histidine kinase n=1 Tax=Sediminicola sp. YIK13 TaxID=1453352 RepID=UPI00071FF092|nr:PAS domain-containing protein [Sediminicola sp. YIK13]ALM06506.1 hypothetical protein SB49_00765 [Sediminicola sp. YIK13]